MILLLVDNIVEFVDNIDDSQDGPTQSLQKDDITLVDNIVEFVDNIDDSEDGPTQSLQKEGISGVDVKEQLQDSPFLFL